MIIPFGTQSYEHAATQLSPQRLVNCFLEGQPEGSKSPSAIIRTPGIRAFADLTTGPVRGAIVHAGDPYYVSGTKLYKLVGTTETEIGDIPGGDPVDMISNGSQLGILANQNFYVYETDLAIVTDDGYSAAIDVTYLDLFAIFAKADSQEFFITNPAASPFPDFTDFNALDFAEAEASPGNIVAVATDHRDLYIFKNHSTEIWANTGNATFPFQPIGNAAMEIGCAAKDSIAKADNSLFWFANDMTIRRTNGYTPVRVSTHAIEDQITKMTTRSDARAFSHPYNGHLFYVITFPTENKTFVYDTTTGLWHNRETEGREWRPRVYLYADNEHYVGDNLSGKIGILDGEMYQDFSDPHRVSITSPVIQQEGKNLFFRKLQIDFDMGNGVVSGDTPQAMLQWSDDGGKTWSSEYWRSIGREGEYKTRAVWHRLGASRNRVFRLTFADNSPFTLIQAVAEVELGS